MKQVICKDFCFKVFLQKVAMHHVKDLHNMMLYKVILSPSSPEYIETSVDYSTALYTLDLLFIINNIIISAFSGC